MVFSLNVCFSVSISFSHFLVSTTLRLPQFFKHRVKQQIISLSQLQPSLALPLSLPFSLFSFLKNRSNKQVVALHEDSICGFATICNLFIWMLGFFLIFFFLYLFFFLLVCTSTKHFYRPKQPDFTSTADTRPVFSPV